MGLEKLLESSKAAVRLDVARAIKKKINSTSPGLRPILENTPDIFLDYNTFFQGNPLIESSFESYDAFVKEIWRISYGLEFNGNLGNPQFNEVQEKIPLTKRIHLFKLLRYLEENYKDLHPTNFRYDDYDKDKVRSGGSPAAGGRPRVLPEGSIISRILTNPFENTFGILQDYRGNDEKPYCLFQNGDHWIGSLLHSASPETHYLHTTSEEPSDERYNVAILIETKAIKNQDEKYLLVEGVLGNNCDLFPYIWKGIIQFALEKGYGKVILNTQHSENQNEPIHFINYVAKKEKKRLNYELISGKKRDKGYLVELNKEVEGTHKIISSAQGSEHFSMFIGSEQQYRGEQYNDSWHSYNKKNHFGLGASFSPTKGTITGAEIDLKRDQDLHFFKKAALKGGAIVGYHILLYHLFQMF